MMEVIQLLDDLTSSIGIYSVGEWISSYGIAFEEHQQVKVS